MPFKSKRQQRAAFGGHIPGISKEKAKEWAKETPSFADLPERAPAEKGQPTLLSKEAQTVNKRLLDAIDAAGVPVAAFPSGYLDHAAAAYIPKFLGPIQEHVRDQMLTQPNIAPNTAESIKKFLQLRPGGVHFYGGRAAALHERPGVVAHEFGHAIAEKKFPNVTKAESAAKLLFGGNRTAPVAGFIVGASTGEGSSKTRENAAPLLTAAATGLPLASMEGQAWYHGLGPLRQAGGDVAAYHDMNARNLISQAAPVALRGAVGYAAGRGARRAFDHLRRRKAEVAVEEEAAKQSQLAHGADSGDGLPPKAIRKGQKVEMEHTKNPATARQIAIDHLRERPDYYARLAEAEKHAEGRWESEEEADAIAAQLKREAVERKERLAAQKVQQMPPSSRKLIENAKKDLPGLEIDHAFDMPDTGYFSSQRKPLGRIGADWRQPHIVAHELGHAEFDRTRFGKLLQGLANDHGLSSFAEAASVPTGFAAGYWSGAQEDPNSLKALLPGAAAGGLLLGMHAPYVLPEAVASLKGLRRMRAAGIPAAEHNHAGLLRAFGTYAKTPALYSAGGVGSFLLGRYAGKASRAKQLEDARLAETSKQAALSGKEISKNLFDAIEAAGVPLKHVSPEALPEGALAVYMPKYVQDSLSPADLKEVSDAGFTFGGIHLPRAGGSNRWGIPTPGAEDQTHFNPSILAHEFGHAVAERKYPRVAKAEQAANDFVTERAALLSLGAGLATGRNSSTAREVLTPLGIMAAAALPLAVTEGQAWYHGLAPLRQAGGNALHYHAKNLGNLAGQAAVPAVAAGLSYGLGRGARYIYDRVRHGPKEKEAALSPTAIRALQHGGIGAGAGALVGAGAGAAGADPNQRGRGALRGALTGAGIGFAGGAGGSLLHSRIKPPPLATSRAAMGTSPTIMAHAPAQSVTHSTGRPASPPPQSLTFPERTSAFQVTNPTEYRHFESKGWKLGPGDMMYPPHALEDRGEAMGARIESFAKKKAAADKQSASVSELEARLNRMQAEQEHAARADRIVHGLDALGLGILAAPAAGELAAGVGKRLEGRGGLIGGVGSLLHHGGEAVHHRLGEGTGKAIGEVVGLGLMVPHLVHPIAHRLTHPKIAPAPSTLAPSVPEQPQAASDMRAMSSAAEKVGRLLARPAPQEKVSGLGSWAWKNKKTLAGVGAVGAVGAGLYGAKKGIDTVGHMATEQHAPSRAVGVPPGMRPPAPDYMPIGSQ